MERGSNRSRMDFSVWAACGIWMFPLICSHCGAEMQLIALIDDNVVIEKKGEN